MRKFLVLALAIGALASFGEADAGHWVTEQVKWDGGVDSVTITTEADTTRTAGISTKDWDWAALGNIVNGKFSSSNTGGGLLGLGAADSTLQKVPVAIVRFVATSEEALDSLYYAMEHEIRPGLYTRASLANNDFAAAAGGVAEGDQDGSNALLEGVIMMDQDALALRRAQNVWGSSGFRLNVIGDVSAAAHVASGLKLYITYLKRD